MTKLDISIVVGKEKKFILSCLASIYKTYKYPVNIFVTSNLASKEIINKIKSQFLEVEEDKSSSSPFATAREVKVVINKSEKGFAQNHNRIIEKTSGKYILILNDDVQILKGAIEKLVDYMEKHLDVGVVSPNLLNPNLTLQHSTYSFPNLFTSLLNISGVVKLIPFNKVTYKIASLFFKKGGSRFWEHNKICQVDTLRGACVLVRRKAIEEVGLMDEITLAYGEETEWHYRFKKKGWKIVFYPKAAIIHYGKQTTGEQPLYIKAEKIKGLLNFYRKHKGKFNYYFLRLVITFISFWQYLFSLITMQKEKADLHFKIIKIALNPEGFFRGKRIFY